MTNHDKLKELLIDVFLLEESEFGFDLEKDDIDSWDSMGTVAVAVGVQETFGYHFKQEEAIGLKSIQDILKILEENGVHFDE